MNDTALDLGVKTSVNPETIVLLAIALAVAGMMIAITARALKTS